MDPELIEIVEDQLLLAKRIRSKQLWWVSWVIVVVCGFMFWWTSGVFNDNTPSEPERTAEKIQQHVAFPLTTFLV